MLKSTLTSFAVRLEKSAYALLRLVSGATFSFHGMQKLFGLYTTYPKPPFGTQIWLGGVIELLCGLLIAIGFLTRPAAFLASGAMAMAYVQFHWQLSLFEGRWLPVVNQGELALLYCFLFLYIFAHGAGSLSLDRNKR